MTDLMVAPPKPGDASYPLYQQEVTGIFSSLKRRASKVSAAIVHSLLRVEFSVFLLVRFRSLIFAAVGCCSELDEERVVHQPRRCHVR